MRVWCHSLQHVVVVNVPISCVLNVVGVEVILAQVMVLSVTAILSSWTWLLLIRRHVRVLLLLEVSLLVAIDSISHGLCFPKSGLIY